MAKKTSAGKKTATPEDIADPLNYVDKAIRRALKNCGDTDEKLDLLDDIGNLVDEISSKLTKEDDEDMAEDTENDDVGDDDD